MLANQHRMGATPTYRALDYDERVELTGSSCSATSLIAAITSSLPATASPLLP